MTFSDPTTLRTSDELKRTSDLASGARTGAVSGAGATSRSADEGTRLELIEERLEAHTQPVQVGEVIIRKTVVTETRTIQVPVQREELVVERRAIERGSAAQPQQRPMDEFEQSLAARFRTLQEGQTIRLQLTQEEVVVEKRPVVYEEVLIGKRALQEVQQVSGTVRREELKVGRRGEVEVSNVRRVADQAPELPTTRGADLPPTRSS